MWRTYMEDEMCVCTVAIGSKRTLHGATRNPHPFAGFATHLFETEQRACL